MPRRNAPARRSRAGRRSPLVAVPGQRPTTDELARDLVDRGLCGPVILGPLARPWRRWRPSPAAR